MLTEVMKIELYQELEKQQQQDGNLFLCKIIVIIDDAFGHDTSLALCQLINFKGLEMYWKLHNPFIVAHNRSSVSLCTVF